MARPLCVFSPRWLLHGKQSLRSNTKDLLIPLSLLVLGQNEFHLQFAVLTIHRDLETGIEALLLIKD
jgi:hypothetical protein